MSRISCLHSLLLKTRYFWCIFVAQHSIISFHAKDIMLRENTFLPSSLTRFLVTENLQHVNASPSSNGIVSSKNYNLFLRAHLKSLKIVNQTKHIQDIFVFRFFCSFWIYVNIITKHIIDQNIYSLKVYSLSLYF